MNQQDLLTAIAESVHELGGRALLVGGCVRDHLLGIPCYDIDCEIHGIEPSALRTLLSRFGEIDGSGETYGIYTLKGAGLDFALPRTERRTGEGHKDFVVFPDPEGPKMDTNSDSLKRRLTSFKACCFKLSVIYILFIFFNSNKFITFFLFLFIF